MLLFFSPRIREEGGRPRSLIVSSLARVPAGRAVTVGREGALLVCLVSCCIHNSTALERLPRARDAEKTFTYAPCLI